MRKVFILLLLAISCVAMAQEIEKLSPQHFDGDPMTGMSSGTLWSSDHVGIWLPDNGISAIRLKMKDHIFIKNLVTKIGYYTADNQLIGMGTALRVTPSQDGTRMDVNVFFSKDSIPLSMYSEKDYVMKKSWRVRVKDIILWLQDTEGYIRITTQTYGGYLYDVRFRLRKE